MASVCERATYAASTTDSASSAFTSSTSSTSRTTCTANAALSSYTALSTIAAGSADACFSAIATSCSNSYSTYRNIQVSISSANQALGNSKSALAAVTTLAASSACSTPTFADSIARSVAVFVAL